MAEALNMSELSSKLGTYAQTNLKEIFSTMLSDKLSFMQYFGNLLHGPDEVPLVSLIMEDILQPGQKNGFNPKEGAKFKDRIAKVRPCKVDLTFGPERIANLWKSYIGMISGGRIDPYKIPFEQFIFAKVVSKAKDNLQKKAVFKGVYNKPGEDPSDTMDGLIRLIQKAGHSGEIPAGNIVAATPAITDSNAVDVVKAVYNAILSNNEELAESPLVCLMSPKNYNHYNECYLQTYASSNYNTEFKKRTLNQENVELISEVGLSGTNHIIITPKENLFWLTDGQSMDNIIVEKEKRNIHLLMDFGACPDFAIGEYIFTNIQAAA